MPANYFKATSLAKCFIKLLVIVIIGTSLNACSNGNQPSTKQKARYINDSATSDTPVETLKTLTAEISAVEQQNQKLIEQNKALTEQDKKTLAQFKNDMLADVQKQMNEFKNANQTTIEEAKKTIDNPSNNKSNNRNNGSIDSDATKTNDNLTWVDDLQSSSATKDSNSTLSLNSVNNSNKNNSLSLLNLESEKLNNAHENNLAIIKKIKQVPYYTIPVNATLTGAIAMQPLIGRVPIDGKVPDPYTFKVVIGAKNLAANGIDIPSEVQGIVASGVAQGDMLGSCARGEITSITFVFQDGRISTTQAKNGEYLGTIAAANGNPCILGSFHSNAAIYLGAQATLAGMQGYGNALSQSQLSNSVSSSGSTISQLIGSANKYAFGQGFSAASQSASKWWEQRVQNSFDFVFVPNVDQQTGNKLMLNINITQEISIDYDPQGRKLFYAHDFNAENLAELD